MSQHIKSKNLVLPPGYDVEERAYGPVVVDRTTDRLVFVATRPCSGEWIEEECWEDFADYIRDMIVKHRVAPEFADGSGP